MKSLLAPFPRCMCQLISSLQEDNQMNDYKNSYIILQVHVSKEYGVGYNTCQYNFPSYYFYVLFLRAMIIQDNALYRVARGQRRPSREAKSWQDSVYSSAPANSHPSGSPSESRSVFQTQPPALNPSMNLSRRGPTGISK